MLNSIRMAPSLPAEDKSVFGSAVANSAKQYSALTNLSPAERAPAKPGLVECVRRPKRPNSPPAARFPYWRTRVSAMHRQLLEAATGLKYFSFSSSALALFYSSMLGELPSRGWSSWFGRGPAMAAYLVASKYTLY